jgi:formate C-acetyltransferase
MLNFEENRKYIENEFEMAAFDKKTGLTVDELTEYLKNVQANDTDTPRQIVCANAYAYLLDNVQLEINEHTPFSVKLNIGVDYSYFASIDIFDRELFQEQRNKVLSDKFPKEFEKMRADKVSFGTWTDFWHTVPDWDNLLKLGFSGILESAEQSKQKLLNSENYEEKQIVFLDSVIICYQAILRLLKRIYDYSLNFDVIDFSECIYNLMQRPPKTLYEVMLFSVLFLYFEEIGCERARTLGDVDRLYLPYYEDDLKKGISKDSLDELFRFFFIHFTATKRFAEQPLCLGGCDDKGNDRSNELTLRILEIYDDLNIYDPKIHLRYHKNLNRDVFEKAVSMIRKGHSSICIMNDDAVFAGYERLGIPKEDSQNYVLLGCYEPIIMGLEHGEIGAVWLNMVKSVEYSVNGGKDIVTGRIAGLETDTEIDDFDAFMEVFFKQLDYCIDFNVDFAQRQGKYCTLINPSPIYSSSFSECIEKGRDIHEYPLKYNNMGIKLFGMATVVDSLSAIKKYVFEKKEISLSEMRTALASNWVGYEDIQQRILNDADKYGNNRLLPDSILISITKHLDEKYCGMELTRGGRLRLGLDSIDICMYLGKTTSATPDGRLAGVPVSKNLCASNGKDLNGITAYMQTVLKIDSSVFVNSAPLDFILHPSSVEGEKGLRDFISLMEVFFANGGFALQGNIFNKEMLIDAQQNPEKYSTLQVRVCGWNEYFVKLSKAAQDMFIKQCEVLDK